MWCGAPGYIEFDNISFYEYKSDVSAQTFTATGLNATRIKNENIVNPSKESIFYILWRIILHVLFWLSVSIEFCSTVFKSLSWIPIRECLVELRNISTPIWADPKQKRDIEFIFEACPWDFLESLAEKLEKNSKINSLASCLCDMAS